VERPTSVSSEDGAPDIPLRSKEQLPTRTQQRMNTDRAQMRGDTQPQRPPQKRKAQSEKWK